MPPCKHGISSGEAWTTDILVQFVWGTVGILAIGYKTQFRIEANLPIPMVSLCLILLCTSS